MTHYNVIYFRPSNAHDAPHFSEFFFTPQRMGGDPGQGQFL